MKLWFVSANDKDIVDFFVGGEEGIGCSGCCSANMDGVAVIVVEKEDVVVAFVGWDGKSACLVTVCFAILYVPEGCKALVCRLSDWFQGVCLVGWDGEEWV